MTRAEWLLSFRRRCGTEITEDDAEKIGKVAQGISGAIEILSEIEKRIEISFAIRERARYALAKLEGE